MEGKDAERTLRWRDPAGKLEITERLKYDPATGILSRRDTLTNRTGETIVIRKYAARFPFPPGEYELYSQRSLWGRESQGAWTGIHSGSVTLGSRAGRWCEGATRLISLQSEVETGMDSARPVFQVVNSLRKVMDGIPPQK